MRLPKSSVADESTAARDCTWTSRLLSDEREREDASKRGGSGACQDGRFTAVRHPGTGFDAIAAYAPRPDVQLVAGKDRRCSLIPVLGRKDRRCRLIPGLGTWHGLSGRGHGRGQIR